RRSPRLPCHDALRILREVPRAPYPQGGQPERDLEGARRFLAPDAGPGGDHRCRRPWLVWLAEGAGDEDRRFRGRRARTETGFALDRKSTRLNSSHVKI